MVFFFLIITITGGIKLTLAHQSFVSQNLGGLAQEARELEVKYPPVTGLKPETVAFSITGYVKYIFNFAIATIGLIALGVLIFSGIQYLTSTGKPEVIKSAKTRIKSAFLGILILLFSYLILITINPQLVIFKIPGLEEFVITPLEMPPPEERVPELLGKVKEIAENVKFISGKIKSLAEEICVEGLFSQLPAPNIEKIIEEKQLALLAFGYEILYYKNRAFAEAADLRLELAKLWEEMNYYEIMQKEETEKEIIEYYQKKFDDVKKEYELKQNLETQLTDLAGWIRSMASEMAPSMASPVWKIGMLNYCCDPNFKPCDGWLIEIQTYHDEIEKVCENGTDGILDIIEDIIKLKTIYI